MRFHHNNKTTNFQRHRPINGSVGLTKSKSKSTTIRAKRPRMRFSLLVVAAVFAVVGVAQALNVPAAQADKYDEKIKALQSQINGYNSRAGELAAAADTLNNKISELQNQQAQLQAEINLNNTKRDGLTAQIADNEAKLQVQSEALSKTLADIYYGQKTTALDVLMNSNSVSDYVDKAARQDSMKDQITSSVNQIKDIKVQLEQQKVEVEKLIAQGESQKAALVENQQQQQKILADTQGQEAAYQGMIGQAKAKQAEIQRQQMVYIASLRTGSGSSGIIASSKCGGGYPFCNADPDSTQYAGGFLSYDNARECVNYVQWRIFQITGRMERHGHAYAWPRTSSLSVGAVAVWGGSPYGHVAWVEEIGTGSHAGQILVSDYNFVEDFIYGEHWVGPGTKVPLPSGYYKNW